jgi:exodeoxyribonuclease V alpha subunit
LFAGQTDSRQCLAAAAAVLRRLCVVAGGPGTGKTTTVAQIVALLAAQAAATGSAPPLVALAAPTGKAAARLEEAVHEQASRLAVDDSIRAQLLALQASTLHRLLGWRPGSHSRFRHHRGQRLPHDVVIVDETSMVSLSLMARLIEAVRPDARLILVGDPGQLASIEAGAVLGDIVGPATGGLVIGRAARMLLAEATGHDVAAQQPSRAATIGDGIVVLDRVHRFGAGIARLAEAIRRGDADTVLDVLADAPDGVTWIPVDIAEPSAQEALAPVRDRATAAARTVTEAARAGDAKEAIEALGSFRLLCAHRRGPEGVATWTARIEGWLAAELDDFAADRRWYAGRPVLVTENDYELRLYNGDTGVVVQTGADRVMAAFERRGEILGFSPSRLGAVDTVHAMTIHKSQGSQFQTAAVLLPAPTSRILTRELLYTAATRARELLILAGSEETIRAAVARPVARASGLRWRLWGDAGPAVVV